mmetsp:Transcript_13602/g.29116  ORF Transcript_13602/g.29116 Transcript_13602/m.29116 type:complete len:631 (-) Transcript_13602:438-2330(-)|eukprot:CAMPEP_0202891784 /NCGR_PEP_ID=MMETSP1392-20130828/1757_1 /ASSEMBLY_ACC=CAM_ASM_000868 /TAXON_ID=225041 /ORGANISM="Chlamydomonas chlamydogama, Strain SAG 11-48b" /LENGTH=630 /DNA_ID=CAMNT_0049575637 /DNA_START=113 /DNA_END=2005 /DNA_ORIENTATION=+
MGAGEDIAEQDDFVSPVGYLCNQLPRYVREPPIEAVVFAWGVNEDGQLGIQSDQNVGTPKVVEALLGLRFAGRSFGRSPLVAGSRNTLAIDAEGGVWSWGWNERGTLGHGHRGQERKPKRIAALQGVNVHQVAVNGWHCLALAEGGQLFAWGGNEYLQCGVMPEKRDIVEPVICVPHLKVRMVACGGMHTLALTETGEVWTWGEPWGDFAMKVERNPRPVSGATGMAAIACGAFHNMALSRRGEVYTWGTNDYGQLGNGNTSYQIIPKRVLDLDHVQVSDIAAGGWHSLVLSVHGEVFTWGRGEYGRLGIGDRTGSSKLRPQLVRGLEGHRIVQVAAGGTHTLALSSRGRLFIWGRGSFGRLGLGAEKDMYHPVECELPGGSDRWRVMAISCGGRHSICLALPVRDGLGSVLDSDDDVDGGSEPSLFDHSTRDAPPEGNFTRHGAPVPGAHTERTAAGDHGTPSFPAHHPSQPTTVPPRLPPSSFETAPATIAAAAAGLHAPQAAASPGRNNSNISLNAWPSATSSMPHQEEGGLDQAADEDDEEDPDDEAQAREAAEAAAEQQEDFPEEEEEEDQGDYLEERRALSPMPRPMSPVAMSRSLGALGSPSNLGTSPAKSLQGGLQGGLPRG